VILAKLHVDLFKNPGVDLLENTVANGFHVLNTPPQWLQNSLSRVPGCGFPSLAAEAVDDSRRKVQNAVAET
jgi:hypothetical protein